MLNLINEGSTTHVPAAADENPYVFRRTEVDLFGESHRPLSAVRDMIGSQSTKGLHFIAHLGARRVSAGVWTFDHPATHAEVSIIETYPAPCRRSAAIAGMVKRLGPVPSHRRRNAQGERFRSDLNDAGCCSLVAWMYERARDRLVHPKDSVLTQEGWIWLPCDCMPSKGSNVLG
jgi:hypothetical protein